VQCSETKEHASAIKNPLKVANIRNKFSYPRLDSQHCNDKMIVGTQRVSRDDFR